MKRGKGRGGQINLSFGMIFSIILIIIFIAFAFYAITKFLNLQKSATVGQFVENFGNDVDQMWKSSSGSQAVTYSLPSSISYVCFTDFSRPKSGVWGDFYDSLKKAHYDSENTFFYPIGSSEGVDSVEIKNIDLSSITQKENPSCVQVVNGKVTFTISKDLSSARVMVAGKS